VTLDSESGQTILSGMGELHLVSILSTSFLAGKFLDIFIVRNFEEHGIQKVQIKSGSNGPNSFKK
jgi:hypothetical protein